MQRVLRGVIRAIMPLLIRLEVVGRENLHQEGAYILATNHLSAFDTPILLAICPRPIRALAAAKHRRNPLYAPLLAMGGSIWVRRGEIDRHALREALAWLRAGGVLGMAPEGTRARGVYALQKAKTGVAYLATRADVPIVPVGLSGTERIKENLPHLRRTEVRAVIGAPFRLPESGRVHGPELEAYTDLVMAQIAALLPAEYRGVYA